MAIGERGERLKWPDALRGFTICAVVFYHAGLFLSGFGFDMSGLIGALSAHQRAGLGLFFAVSGMLAARYIDSSWAECLKGRLGPMIWMLALWSVLHWLLWSLFPDPRHPEYGRDLIEIPRTFVMPSPILWYLWALIAYLVLARLVRRAPPWLVVGVSGVLALLIVGMSDYHLRRYGLTVLLENFPLRMSLLFFVFYYLGYRFRDRILALSRWPLLPSLAGFIGGAYLLLWLRGFFPSVLGGGAVGLGALCLGLVGSIHLARALLHLPGLGRLFLGIGRVTLPVYLSHMLFVAPLVYVLLGFAPAAVLAHGGLVTLAIGSLSIAGALVFAFLVPRLRLMWLFAPPGTRIAQRTSA